MLFSHEVVRASLSIDCQLAILQVVFSQALVYSGVDVVEDRKSKTRDASHVHSSSGSLYRRQTPFDLCRPGLGSVSSTFLATGAKKGVR